ncbi:Multidrug resistance-associated protein 4 [Folsomia candida]|uniref:Multidrug resistance-associated protein 4 n=1 Tax=Folsomia candida TaxID=158441 RepID=A0A226EKW2_FOLCA|nr:Multidrug resistance-associated protein 4 [Folsomia candida]
MDIDFKKSVPNPWEKANILSQTLFTWILPLFRKGFSNELSLNDLHDAPSVHTSQDGADKLQKVMQPIYLRKLVRSFSDDSATRNDQALYGGIVCLCALFHDIMIHQCVYLMFRTGLLTKTAISSLLYKKSLRIRSEDSEVGKLVNLLSNDLGRFDYQLVFMPYIFIGPFQLIILVYVLWLEMGISAFAVLNGRFAAKFRRSVAAQTDKRAKFMNEIVMAIRIIKMYGWEAPFSTLLNKIRRKEVSELGKRAYLRGFFLSLYTFSTRLTAFFVILAYVLLGNQLTAENAFFSVAISLTIVETMVFYFSSAISGLGECSVSIQRVQKYLLLPEQSKNNTTSDDTHLIDNGKIISTDADKLKNSGNPGRMSLKHVSASWSSAEKITLNDLTFEVKGDEFVMIVGPVGSGKTSLLNLLISELPILEGSFASSGKISYAAQEPWIFPGNVRQNILFGEAFDPHRYEQVITACALKDDFNLLPNGDKTLVGERGITLSGGQKARLNLARSFYHTSSNIFLMDDPLSAVDSRVSRHIFDKGIQGFLKGKLRILVTHQLQYLSQADYIIFLNNGSIHAQGTYDNLIKSGVDFMSIMASDSTDHGAQRKLSVVEAPQEENKVLKEFEKPADNTEKTAEGSVSMRTYWSYITSAKSSVGLFLVIFLFLCGQILLTGCETDSEDYRIQQQNDAKNDTAFDSNPYLSSTMSSYETIVILDRKNYLGQDTYLIVYSVLVVSLFAFTIVKSSGFFGYCLRISNNLHDRMFKAVVRAPTKFFDDNPSGRILNRFSKEIGSIDEMLPASFYDTFEYTLQMLGVVFIIVLSNYLLIIPTIVITIIFWALRIIFVRTSRDIKRLESNWKSPVFTHVAASLQGLTTIRALGAEEKLIKQFDQKQDVHTATWFAFISTTRCFAVWAETVAIIFLTAVTFSFILLADDDSTGGIVGLVVTSTLALSVNIQWAIRQSAETTNHMASTERILEYISLSPEAPLELPEHKPPSDWPLNGEIKFNNVFLKYEDNFVLKNLNFDIHPQEKIGIVGRTGAGKSSIIAALFRLTEPEGSIFIDGVLITKIGLHDLRKNISIIPQDPVLFSGTIRYNLDPFQQFEDAMLWQVLEEVQLKDAVSALDFKVSNGGSLPSKSYFATKSYFNNGTQI